MVEETSLAGALHEVSNALTVVLGWISEAQVRADSPSVKQALAVAHEHARRGHRVARSALGAVGVEGGLESELAELARALPASRGASVPVSSAPAREVAAKAVIAVEREAVARGVVLVLSEGTDSPSVADCDAVLQVLVNLLLNGISFSPRGETLTLDVTAANSVAYFTVSDRGPGVPADVKDQLFRARKSLRPGGAGIGLQHSHALASQHGGTLRLLDAERGARFEVAWPCVTPAGLRSGANRGLQGLSIGVLEDDPAVLELIEFGLIGNGATVFPVQNLEQLLALIRSAEPPDVLLLDLSPLSSAPSTVHQELERVAARCPVLLISGSAPGPESAVRHHGWVRKPFELGELYEAIQAVRASQWRAETPDPVVRSLANGEPL